MNTVSDGSLADFKQCLYFLLIQIRLFLHYLINHLILDL